MLIFINNTPSVQQINENDWLEKVEDQRRYEEERDKRLIINKIVFEQYIRRKLVDNGLRYV